MTELATFRGVFAAEYAEHGATQATLRHATGPNGTEFESVRLRFDQNVERLLQQGAVPPLYGTPLYTVYPALIRGRLDQPLQGAEQTISDIVYIELIDESPDSLVTYSFRLDGANYLQKLQFPELSKGSSAFAHPGAIRLPCRFLYFPDTKQFTITSKALHQRIRIPEHVVPQLLNRLPLDLGDGPYGTVIPIMSTTGVIEGSLQFERKVNV